MTFIPRCKLLCLLGCLLLLLNAGCQSLSHAERGALFGTGLGTIAGAAIGQHSGHSLEGAAVGAVTGAVAGGLFGNAQDSREAAAARYQASQYTRSLTNDDLLQLVQSGLSDAVIINAIRAQGGRFDLGPEGLIALRNAGVSDLVLVEAQRASARPIENGSAQANGASTPDPRLAVGVIVAPRPFLFAPRRHSRWHFHRRPHW